MNTILAQIQHWSAQTPESVALQGDYQQISYGELWQQVELLAAALGAATPNHIGILMDNSPEWVVIQLAAFKANIPVTPIPPFFSNSQQQYALNQSGVDLLFCESAEQVARCNGGFEAISALHPLAHSRVAEPVKLPRGTRLVTFTSGSTDTPKGVCLGGALLDQVCRSLFRRVGAAGVTRHACLLPLSVLLENLAGVWLPLYAGGAVLLASASRTGLSGSSGLDLQQLGAFLHQHQPESLILTPELLKALIFLCRAGLSSEPFKLLAVGGARVPETLLQQAQQLRLPVVEGYGLSECGSVVALNAPGEIPNGCGRPLDHCHVSISPEGEVLVHGPAMLGYIGDHTDAQDLPHLISRPIATGDLGYLDEKGRLHIQGRRKNLCINSFGRNFSPEWIEAEFGALPQIQQFCLFGDDRPFNVAVIVPRPSIVAQALADAIDLVNASLPDYARVSRWVIAEQPFSPINGQLTANGRLRRAPIAAYYRDAIEHAYQIEEPATHAVL